MTRPLLVDAAATIVCAHGGQALAATPASRVTVGAVAPLTIDAPVAVTGCMLPPAAGGPCAHGTWLTGTTRVATSGRPFVTASSGSLCTPTGTPLVIVATQTRVTAA